MRSGRVGLAIAATVLMSVWAGGCQEEGAGDVKKHRLIAAENRELRARHEAEAQQIKDLTKRLEECEEQRNQLAGYKDQSDQLAKCTEERDNWKDRAEREIKENVEQILALSLNENVALREENGKLRAEIEKLKAQNK